jgi:hypothetical protein
LFESLHYKSTKNRWQILPDWAKWYINTGMYFGVASLSEKRIILGISAPVIGYASLFLALGIICKRSEILVENFNNEDYFDFLKSQPPDTCVSFLTSVNGKLKRRDGLLGEPYRQESGKVSICIVYVHNPKENKKCSKFFDEKDCRKIVVTESREMDLSSTKKKGTSVVNNLSFLLQFLEDNRLIDFITTFRLECLIIGSKKRFFAEIDYPFCVKSGNGKSIVGNLKDILRPKNLDIYKKSYRLLSFSAFSKKPPIDDEKPWCVIFDSANGYLKWNHRFDSSHQIVLLDRTETLYENAASHLNNRYYNRVSDITSVGLKIPVLPDGIEIISFIENSHA